MSDDAHPQWHRFDIGDESTWPPENGEYWAAWRNGSRERQVWNPGGIMCRALWGFCTYWMEIEVPRSPYDE